MDHAPFVLAQSEHSAVPDVGHVTSQHVDTQMDGHGGHRIEGCRGSFSHGGIKVAVVQRPSPQPANHGVGVVLTCKPGVRVSGVPLPE